MKESGYYPGRSTRKLLHLVAIGGLFLLGAAPALAQDSEVFSGGGKAGKAPAYSEYSYAAAPYAVDYDDTLYLYGTADDGKGYYSTYDGSEWSEYAGWENQPADYQWQPVAVTYNDSQYVYYTGQDDKLYQNVYDGQAWAGWEDVSGAYTYANCAYAHTYADNLYVYGVASDGNVYGKYYDGSAWTEWAAVNDTYAAAAYQPYAIDWSDHENVFWTGDNGTIYWNRYDGTEWAGAKALEGEYQFDTEPYAVGYDDKLYAYANTGDGVPYYNVFTEGEGWAGWEAYPQELPAKSTYQPSVAVYEDAQHAIYTGDDGHAYYATYDGSWSDWADLGENYAYEPIQYEYDDTYYLAYTGEDGGLYYKTYAGEDDGY